MSEKAYRTMRSEVSKREENLASRNYLAHVNHLQNKLDAARLEIERLTEELDRARNAYARRAVEAKAYRTEASHLSAELERERESKMGWYRSFIDQRQAHLKLSLFVRLAPSPDDYLMYRYLIDE